MFNRREFLMVPIAATALLASPTGAVPATRRFDASARLQSLEVGQARLGVCFLDTATGEASGNRMEERFAMCSTFKLAMDRPCGSIRISSSAGPHVRRWTFFTAIWRRSRKP